jgi:hypothetical protein
MQSLHAQNPRNWTDSQLVKPALLAAKITSGKDVPVIISVGPGALIPQSVNIGMARDQENLDKLKTYLQGIPKQTALVIYCGCCPFEHCPNVRPALDLLQKMNFTNYQLLDLPHNLKTDWIDKGFPVVQDKGN